MELVERAGFMTILQSHFENVAKGEGHAVFVTGDEKEGVVMCLAQARDANALIQTHKEAHGLIPALVSKVKQSD